MSHDTNAPLVSCIMPTYNRRTFVRRSIELFLRQDYPNKELIVVDDGTDPVDDLIPTNAPIRYWRVDRRLTVGAKRNLACEQARGVVIAHWDDDDWQAPRRLRYQLDALQSAGADLCGLNELLFYDTRCGQAWRYIAGPSVRRWLGGSTLCYSRALWARHRFANTNIGEDSRFVWAAREARLVVLPDPTFHVGLIHVSNVSPKQTSGSRWRAGSVAVLRNLLGTDWEAFAERSLSPTLPPAQAKPGQTTVTASRPRGCDHSLQSGESVSDSTHPDLGLVARIEPKGASMYLDDLTPSSVRVGYGSLGRLGSLGYEDRQVIVAGRRYAHALSSHPPARVRFELRGRFSRFQCAVALNDDVARRSTYADFTILGDGRPLRSIPSVRPGQAPCPLTADVTDVDQLELIVETTRWDYCHAVWLDPTLDERNSSGLDLPGQPVDQVPTTLIDCLGRAEIELPVEPTLADRCIATVVSPGYEGLLDDMLGSLLANGNVHDARLLVFGLNINAACERVAAKYGATLIRCRSRAPINAMSKSLLYSIARVVQARQFVCLDADMLILGDLRPLFDALDALPDGAILTCREGNHQGFGNLGQSLSQMYSTTPHDLRRHIDATDQELAYPLVVNDGLFAAGRTAMLALDEVIRALPHAAAWSDQRRDVWWRNQFLFNLALARLQCGVELDATYNLQLHAQDVSVAWEGARLVAEWQGRRARVLHLSGIGRNKLRHLRGIFASVPDPLVTVGGGDGYAAFVKTLRAWTARYGLRALAWSMYGTTDATTANVRDGTTFPLLALLHYLVRANGCIRVLETGTARGVSAACLASAVAHRPLGRVVSFDPYPHPERRAFWEALPAALRDCIEERATDSIAGMQAALAAGEQYELALLDSVHTEEHVWSELELATQLVCPGGLILVHDARYAHGTVDAALRRMAAAGYGVTRLWCAERGVEEDDRLGLAVIENRRHPDRSADLSIAETEAETGKSSSSALSSSATGRSPDEATRPGSSARESSNHATRAAVLAPEFARGVSTAMLRLQEAQPDVPLVSCIMPTRDRRRFVGQAIRYFERQVYPNRELIVLDDGVEPVDDLIPNDARIRYVRLPTTMSIGAKRNRACDLARGEIVAQWDDDDWYGVNRLWHQITPLLDGTADLTGLGTPCFFDLANWRAWTCTPALHRRLFVRDVHGGTLVYWRRVWERLARYPDVSLAEDAQFLSAACRRGARLLKLPGASSFVYVRHTSNAWQLRLTAHGTRVGWAALEPDRFIPPEDLSFYSSLADAMKAGPTATILSVAQGRLASGGRTHR